jgi:hypothetical protein
MTYQFASEKREVLRGRFGDLLTHWMRNGSRLPLLSLLGHPAIASIKKIADAGRGLSIPASAADDS